MFTLPFLWMCGLLYANELLNVECARLILFSRNRRFQEIEQSFFVLSSKHEYKYNVEKDFGH